MIKLIGFRRMVFLACLLALNLSVLTIYFFNIGPMLDTVTSQRDAIDGQIKTLRTKINGIKQDMVYEKDNLPKYNELKDKGFFLNQDRFTISRAMEQLRVQAKIDSFSYAIGDVAEIPNEDAKAINYKLINSRIKVDKIVSPLDSHIYTLVQDMADVLPRYVRLQDMNITRSTEVTEAALKDIAAGKPVSFVNADLEFDWITMVPNPTDSTAGAGSAPAGFRRQ